MRFPHTHTDRDRDRHRHSGVCAMSDEWRAILKSILDSVFNNLHINLAIDMLGLSMDKWSTSISVLHCIYLRNTNKTRTTWQTYRCRSWRAGSCLSQLSLWRRRYRFTTVASSNSSKYRSTTVKCCVSSRTIKTELKSRTATSKYEMTWKWMRRRRAMATTRGRQIETGLGLVGSERRLSLALGCESRLAGSPGFACCDWMFNVDSYNF